MPTGLTCADVLIPLLLLAPVVDKPTDEQAVKKVLGGFHQAAAKADGDRYFGHAAPQLVFFGTDAGERWSLSQFQAYARPYFSKGKGWTYVPTRQNVTVSKDRQLAWFDEQLAHSKYGVLRGSGALLHLQGEWKIVQYNLAFQIPNQLVRDGFTQKIDKATGRKVDQPLRFPQRPATTAKDPRRAAKEVLMDWHRAASEADASRYFGHLTENAIVLGTDAAERWTPATLRAVVRPAFAQKTGWTTVPIKQNVYLAKGGRLAWFDERLISSRWGEMRGTGVLQLVQGKWKIAHYNTVFPIPNSLAPKLLEEIKKLKAR